MPVIYLFVSIILIILFVFINLTFWGNNTYFYCLILHCHKQSQIYVYYYGKDLFARGLPDDVCFACAIKGKVNDVPQIRKIFSQFKIKGVGTVLYMWFKESAPAQELIISNCNF